MIKNLISKSNNWKDDLPEVFAWIKTVKIGAQPVLQVGTQYVVAVKPRSDQPETFELDAKLDESTSGKVLAGLQAMGWTGRGTPCRLTVDQINFVAISQAPAAVHKSQIGRQIGIDAAAAFLDFSGSDICFVETSSEFGADILEGFLLSQYHAGIFKTTPGIKLPHTVALFNSKLAPQRFEEIRVVSEAAMFMRFLQDSPPNWLNSAVFAQIARDISSENGLSCKVIGPEEMHQHQMGAFLAVGHGSEVPPQMIIIDIPGTSPSAKTVALIGKGLTFDAGGISIKPSASMEEMKYDMSGAAAVLGTAMILAKQRPAHRVLCMIGAVENVISGVATRPSDVVRTMSGKTVEILNTDAEGRLVLCDMMAYAKKYYNPSLMVDIATLTGAVLFALGHFGSAVLSGSDKIADLVTSSGNDRGEPLWRLPLWPETSKEVKGEFGDLANIPKPNVKAGTIMGAAFLREFAGDTPWAHIDVAGTAWSCMATGFPKVGGSSYGLRTLVEVCRRFEA